jgi:hypothetical protein
MLQIRALAPEAVVKNLESVLIIFTVLKILSIQLLRKDYFFDHLITTIKTNEFVHIILSVFTSALSPGNIICRKLKTDNF